VQSVPKHSLERRILLGIALAFAAGAGALALSLYDTRDQLRRAVISIQAQEISADFGMHGDPAALPRSYAGGELSYTLYSSSGQVLWFSDNLERPRRLRPPMTVGQWPLFRLPIRSGEVVNVAVPLADGTTLMVAKRDVVERELIGQLLRAKLRQSLIIVLPICLLCVGLIYWIMRWTLRPVQEASRLAQNISPDNPQPIPTAGLPREILPLMQAANQALEKLAQALEHEKRFVADAAHELRTPLTVLDLRLQQSRHDARPDWESIDADMAYLRRITGQLMLQARQESGVDLQDPAVASSSTQLSRLVREIVASMLPLFEAQARQVEAEIPDTVFVRGHAHLLQTAIRNVLENALFHGQGTVGLVMCGQDDTVYLTITDEGPGVPEDKHEEMFVRFRKGSQSSQGAGLGLAVTRQILRNLGGDVRFLDRPFGAIELQMKVSPRSAPPAVAFA